MLKIHRFNCAGLDVHKNLIVATIGITDKKTRVTEYIQKDFSSLLLTMISITLKTGLLSTNALMSAWNLPVNIGSLSSIFLRLNLK